MRRAEWVFLWLLAVTGVGERMMGMKTELSKELNEIALRFLSFFKSTPFHSMSLILWQSLPYQAKPGPDRWMPCTPSIQQSMFFVRSEPIRGGGGLARSDGTSCSSSSQSEERKGSLSLFKGAYRMQLKGRCSQIQYIFLVCFFLSLSSWSIYIDFFSMLWRGKSNSTILSACL